MPLALPAAIALFAQAAVGASDPAPQVYGPAAPAAKPAPAPVKTAQRDCAPSISDPNSREIVVCAPKPQGYRIDPDVLKAKREKREALAGRPKPPENFKDHSCRVVGPAPCMDAPMINLLAAAATIGEIADRLSKGQEIGSIFVTEPQQSEYQLYLAAKREREAKEAAAAAKAKSARPAQPAAPAK